MLGNIIGDLAGSIYEFEQFTSCRGIKINNLIEENAFFSDDTILTVAVLDAILSHVPYEDKLREYGQKYLNYLPKFKPYFSTIFSPNFSKWLNSSSVGKSNGNGAMMRVAPIGFLFDSENEVKEQARLATIPSHNCSSAIKNAQLVALIIFYLRHGVSKTQIKDKLNLKIVKPVIHQFNYTCAETIDVVLYSFFNSSSFEDAIKLAISFGGDTDTNACIVGGIAEAMWGISAPLKQKALSFLPTEFKIVLDKVYN